MVDEEPWRTGRELRERPPAERPGQYPDQLLRTLQRRLKIWRKEKAHAMVFGAMQFEPAIEADGETIRIPVVGEHYDEATNNVGREHSTVRQYALSL
ncbi:hypothetical protein [Mesorhizobium sp.]|uniref:hypothetical protein n=1 Tax=Mesorhizobium sp. TaxID=1871066 RepID=UPI0025811460|nr:hypothetical protein [Mesorhizobium sp.]